MIVVIHALKGLRGSDHGEGCALKGSETETVHRGKERRMDD